MRHDFLGELRKPGTDCVQFCLSAARQRVVLSGFAALHLHATNEESVGLQPMQQGVDRPRAEGVTMPSKLDHHAGAEDRLLRRVKQDVNSREGKKNIPGESDH